MTASLTILSVDTATAERLAALLPAMSPRTILVKPNWVRHAEKADFPIEALVTDSGLIAAVLDACLLAYPEAERITVGDVPLQDCDWNLMRVQSGLQTLIDRYTARHDGPTVEFLDLRRERFALRDGFLVRSQDDGGDPRGYREVTLGRESLLEPVSHRGANFRVSDYDAQTTAAAHRPGHHRYLIAASVLEADLIINMPKMKTHQKAGLTGALKNLVGINGEKGYLVHYLRGTPRVAGDEFAPDAALAVRLQVRVRELLQKRSKTIFGLLRPAWRFLRRLRGIRTEGTRENLEGEAGSFYMAGGAWYGNDTIWRMIYDLNHIVRYAVRDGSRLADTPQRGYFAIMDARVAGEGNGPLQPLPVTTGLVLCADDPFILDMAAARLMGFDRNRIPQLAHRAEFGGNARAATNPADVNIDFCGNALQGIDALPVSHRFLPPPGWRGHIELESAGAPGSESLP